VFLYSKVEVLEVIDDDEVKFEEKKICEGTTSEFYRIRRYKIKYGVFFSMHTS
jgi:hypothetical protein